MDCKFIFPVFIGELLYAAIWLKVRVTKKKFVMPIEYCVLAFFSISIFSHDSI
jgi:hypothetical protein